MARAPHIRRDCQCTRANHQHGTRTAYVVDRCRCPECTTANTDRQRYRTRLKLYGRYDAVVDATACRTHIRRLMAQGMGWKRVAAAAGVSESTVYPILYGVGWPGDDYYRPPRKQVTRATHEAIMAVQLDVAPGTPVDARGVRRRLQALVAIGWPQSRLAERLGMTPGNLQRVMHAENVLHRTAQMTRNLYDELWDSEPTAANSYEAGGIVRAKRHARQAGWPPPMGWDDIDLDPEPGIAQFTRTRDRKTHKTAELVEDVEFLLAQGAGTGEIMKRLDASIDAIEQACRRAGRHDLANRIRRAEPRQVAS